VVGSQPDSSLSSHWCKASTGTWKHVLSVLGDHQHLEIAADQRESPAPTLDNGCCPICDNFLYYFKGARSAPGPGWASLLSRAPREDDADPDAAQLPPVAGRAVWGTLRAWAPPAALSPDGHGGVGARAVPATRRTGRAPQRSAPGARVARAAILPALQYEAGQDHLQGRFTSRVMAYGHPCS